MNEVMVQMRRLLGPNEPEADQTPSATKPVRVAALVDGRVTRYGFSALGALELKEDGEWVAYAEVKEALGEMAQLVRSVKAAQQATAAINVDAVLRRWGFNEEDGR